MKCGILYFFLMLYFSMPDGLLSQQFTEIQTGMIESDDNPSISWGDYDNDGDLDILITSKKISTYYSKIYRNDGQNTFTDINAGLIGVATRSSCAWADYDNDGDLDLALAGALTGPGEVLKIYRNDSDDIFALLSNNFKGVKYCKILWGDYDNDGDLDLFVTGDSQNNGLISSLIRNNGNDSFTELPASFTAIRYGNMDLGDYDNDGDVDLLIAGISDNGTISRVFRNDGNNNSTDLQLGLVGINKCDVNWGDIDSDGDLDFVYSGMTEPNIGISKIYLNMGNNTFNYLNSGIENCTYSSSQFGDYDNDGDLDLLLVGTFPYIEKLYKNENLIFTEINSGLRNGSCFKWGDYDNDSDLDLVAGDFYDGDETNIFKNNALDRNTKPNPPTDLSYEIVGDTTILRWTKATDNETLQDGLTYNIRIGTTSNGIDIVSPMADISNGYRRIPEMENCYLNNFYKIYNLAPGEYCWSVQTIDNAFAGSNFSSTDCFIIPNSTGIANNEPNNSIEFNFHDEKIFLQYQTNCIKQVNLSVYSLLGVENKHLHLGFSKIGLNVDIIDVSDITNGFYIFVVQFNADVFIGKFIKTSN